MTRYFIVEKRTLSTVPTSYEVDSGGDKVGRVMIEEQHLELCLGYVVRELDECGIPETDRFYPVITDTADNTDNSDEVLEQIKADYPAGDWQNNEW